MGDMPRHIQESAVRDGAGWTSSYGCAVALDARRAEHFRQGGIGQTARPMLCGWLGVLGMKTHPGAAAGLSNWSKKCSDPLETSGGLLFWRRQTRPERYRATRLRRAPVMRSAPACLHLAPRRMGSLCTGEKVRLGVRPLALSKKAPLGAGPIRISNSGGEFGLCVRRLNAEKKNVQYGLINGRLYRSFPGLENNLTTARQIYALGNNLSVDLSSRLSEPVEFRCPTSSPVGL